VRRGPDQRDKPDHTEAIRALKRRLARRVYTLLKTGPGHGQAKTTAQPAGVAAA
jgi:hypothetical protein